MTTPWYRQFWPWFLIAVPGSVVIASFFMIRLAFTSADILVRDDYYKDGLAINESISRDQLARSLGIGGRLELGQNDIKIIFNNDLQLNDIEGLFLQAHHPFDAQQDMDLTLIPTGESGVYRAVANVQQQRWYIEITPLYANYADGADWRVQFEQDFRNSGSVHFGRSQADD